MCGGAGGANLPTQMPLFGAGALQQAVLVRGADRLSFSGDPPRGLAEPLRISRGEYPDEALQPGVVVLHGTAARAGWNAEAAAVTNVRRQIGHPPC